MGYRNILIKNKNFITLTFVSFFILCFVDMKSFGMISTEEAMLFRLLSQQVFLIFLLPLCILSVLNQKFIQIQKNYLVIYTNNEVLIIKKSANLMMIVQLVSYTMGQLFFVFVNYVYTRNLYIRYLNFHLITILEIIAMSYIIVSFLLILKKNLFVFTVYYVLILLLLVYNNGYISIPMTVKNIHLLSDTTFQLFLSRVVWIIVSLISFRVSLILYKNCFYEE